MIRSILVLLCFGFLSCSSPDKETTDKISSERELDYLAEVQFLRADGSLISTVDAAIADTDELRSAGLMNVFSLPENAGMIFLFENSRARSFWMANTPISLDIIFVNADMEIVRIHRNTTPFSQESIESEKPAKYVVEVNAGYTMEHDITEGALIDYNLNSPVQ